MKKRILAVSLAAILSTSAQADTLLGLYIGGQVWANQAEGVFGESSSQIDFNLDNKQQGSFFIAIEHPLPFIPNLKISSTTLDTKGTTLLSDTFNFGGVDYNVNEEVNATFDVSYLDYTLYYELFDNDLVSFDFGITARDFDGDIGVSSSSSASSLSASTFVPMLYVATTVGLPFTGFNIFAEGNLLSVGDHSLYDYTVGISYELVDSLVMDLNLTFGYRAVKLELEDLDNLNADLEFDGAFIGAVVHF